MASDAQKTSAHIIIHSSAIAAATWSGASAILPGVSVVTDTAGGTIITVAMAFALGNVFNRKLDESAIMGFVTLVIGRELGMIVLKGVFSFIPLFGSLTNATITFGLTEAIGWSLFLIFDEGKDLGKLTKEEIAVFLRRGKSYADEVKKSGEFAWIEELPPHVKAQYDYLTKKLGDKNLSQEERQATLKEIEDLIAPYNPKNKK
ncbi:MAG TPA: hypothetical protein VH599_10090 [Ktedonobacterales bacterium]|jgi:uncharacterized protein (DUF697 family)